VDDRLLHAGATDGASPTRPSSVGCANAERNRTYTPERDSIRVYFGRYTRRVMACEVAAVMWAGRAGVCGMRTWRWRLVGGRMRMPSMVVSVLVGLSGVLVPWHILCGPTLSLGSHCRRSKKTPTPNSAQAMAEGKPWSGRPRTHHGTFLSCVKMVSTTVSAPNIQLRCLHPINLWCSRVLEDVTRGTAATLRDRSKYWAHAGHLPLRSHLCACVCTPRHAHHTEPSYPEQYCVAALPGCHPGVVS
jgi:hypothetical protein